MDPELRLECLNRFTRVQAALGIILPLVPDGFRVFLRVWGKYQLLYRCFLLRLTLSLQPFLHNLPACIGPFLGGIYV